VPCLRENLADSTDTMARKRQPDLFLSDAEPELLEDRPEHVYTADPDEVRRDLLRLLTEARTAKTMPWEPRKVRLYQTIFPQMTNWLPEEEAAQLRFEFAQEMQRLAKAA
jgi:hypothetical protein